MAHRTFAQIKREQSLLENARVTEEISRETIELAKLLEQESPLTFEVALGLIESICKVILPGYQGISRLTTFRTVIRDRFKNEFIGYEESLDQQQTSNDTRNAGCS